MTRKQAPKPGEPIVADFLEPLATKERRALELYAEGVADSGIAMQMRLSQAAVALHLSNVRQKLGCKTKAGAVRKARELGIIALADSQAPTLDSPIAALRKAAKRANAGGDAVHAGTLKHAAEFLHGFQDDKPGKRLKVLTDAEQSAESGKVARAHTGKEDPAKFAKDGQSGGSSNKT